MGRSHTKYGRQTGLLNNNIDQHFFSCVEINSGRIIFINEMNTHFHLIVFLQEATSKSRTSTLETRSRESSSSGNTRASSNDGVRALEAHPLEEGKGELGLVDGQNDTTIFISEPQPGE